MPSYVAPQAQSWGEQVEWCLLLMDGSTIAPGVDRRGDRYWDKQIN